ncbi:transketolase-like TK C-terminal-containing protein [Shinella sp. M31]|uniref:transketolase-like TK C-terminal-containing protein n=1 Tax=Shinella sp. M31 TaxID=3368615 RepID=UPI003BA1E5C9
MLEPALTPETLARLKELERQVLWHACWMIHNANHLREKGEVKVGGHQASSASLASIMTALYFYVLRPEDRVAVKPHASPVFHGIQYLMGNQTREKLENFRGFGGAQSYPSRTKDIDDVDFSTGSVGLGVAITAFASIVQDYIAAKAWSKDRPQGRMIALVGDAELDEGNIYECLQEGWKHDLRNTWWVIDYNRQSLDGVVREGLWQRIEGIFTAFGWDVKVLKYGALQEAAFREPGGAALRDWIDRCPNQLYSALTFQGGAAWRKRLTDEIGHEPGVAGLLSARSDEALSDLMNNLGGHCLETLIRTFEGIDHDRPTVFVAYTIKGWGTPLAGHKDNHAGLMTKAQMELFQSRVGVTPGREWETFGAVSSPEPVRAFLKTVPFFAKGTRRFSSPALPSSGPVFLDDRELSTQAGFGKVLDALAKRDDALSARIVTTAPDVTVSTNLGPWVNRRGLFARERQADTFRDEQVPSVQKWEFGPAGQHIELGIAEMNLFLLLGAAGLSHSLFGERLLPIGTVYDPFVARGLDALNYACYQDARFMIVGTPSGVTLAPEGGAHQSIGSQLIGMSQDGLASFEPAYLDELSVIMDWSFDYMQRDGEGTHDTRTWLRDGTGGSVYLRLTTRPLEQIALRREDPVFRQGVIDGAYWLRAPSARTRIVLAYQGCVAPEVLMAAGRLAERHGDIAVLAVTSADRLNAGWTAAQRARRQGDTTARSHIEALLNTVSRSASLITVTDGHPATLGWLGSVEGHKTISLGVEHFGQTGTIDDLYAHFGIDTQAIIEAADAVARRDAGPLRASTG